MKGTVTTESYKKKLKKLKPTLEVLGIFINCRDPILHRCLIHDIEFEASETCIISGNKGCPECGRDKWRKAHPAKSQKQYIEEVKEGSKGKIKVIGKYINANTKIDHLCKDCNTIIQVKPRSMLTHFGCRNCGYAKGRATGSKYQKIKIGKRVVKVQGGGEKEVIKRLVDKFKVKPNNIIVGSSGKIPGVYYKYKNKRRLYRPDFLIQNKNRLVEVKSSWYFGLNNKFLYYMLVAKAQACIEQGYDFRVFIASLHYSDPILLPKKWYEMSYLQFKEFWKVKYNNIY